MVFKLRLIQNTLEGLLERGPCPSPARLCISKSGLAPRENLHFQGPYFPTIDVE